jgi:putative DNA primase/helicase
MNTSPVNNMSVEDAETAFSAAIADEGYGVHDIPADGVWHNFAFPDNSRGHKSGSAKLTVSNGRIEGVVKDFRYGNSPIFIWRPGARVEVDDEHRARTAAAAAEKEAARERARIEALNLFATLPEASADHPYLARKKITSSHQLKLDGYELVVPIYNARTGEFMAIQRISPNGTKLFPAGSAVAGGCVMPGSLGLNDLDRIHPRSDSPIVICEGYATACAIYSATLYPTIAALSCGNLATVARAIRERFPLKKIVIAADDETKKDEGRTDHPGIDNARDAARAVDGFVAYPSRGDFNDVLVHDVADKVEVLINAAEEAPAEETSEEQEREAHEKIKVAHGDVLIIICASEVEAKKINWLWKPRIACGKLTLLVGMPDVSKSTLSLDIAARVTHGSELPDGEGRAPLGNVVILSAEDDVADTVRPRLEVAGANLARVHIITAVKTKEGPRRNFDLSQDIERLEQAIHAIGNVVLIIIDPFSAYMGKPGKLDSYRSTDVRSVLAPLQEMAARHGIAIIGIGHLNKSGSSPAMLRVLDSVAFVAASRGVYLVVRDPENEDRRLFLPVKNNIGKIRTGLAFRVIEKLTPPPVFDASPAIKWEDGAVNMTADEALTFKQNGRKSKAAERAKLLIAELLANGPTRQTDVEARAKEQQIGIKPLRTAKEAMGVLSTQAGGAWWWSLPGQERPL